MHPAPSIILFSTISGLGFGLLFWLGIDATPPTGWVGFVFFAIALGLAVIGLLSSTFHLGHPERAMKALSQWRTSWLSREGICAIVALMTGGLYGAGLVLLDLHIPWLGWIAAALSLLTVFTTSMIYAQLATVPRWNTPLTPVLFLCIALAGGALLSGRVQIALPLLALSGLLQMAWWMRGDGAFAKLGATLATATGLKGGVRVLAPPHTSPNYLMREMVHQVGRKHARNLRIIAMVLMVLLPIALMLVQTSHATAAIALLSHIVGVAASRWLFFAEAEHTVGLYYGAR